MDKNKNKECKKLRYEDIKSLACGSPPSISDHNLNLHRYCISCVYDIQTGK